MLITKNKSALAYVIGLALGDGNLSNPNKRAVRLRISCDTKYPLLIRQIQDALKKVAPHNKVAVVLRSTRCLDVSCYSNDWEKVLGWKVGSKMAQKIHVPIWIKGKPSYTKVCLRGLLQTDGSIYLDRGYLMVNFVSHSQSLAKDVLDMIESLGFCARLSVLRIGNGKSKYTIRVAKETVNFIRTIRLEKK